MTKIFNKPIHPLPNTFKGAKKSPKQMKFEHHIWKPQKLNGIDSLKNRRFHQHRFPLIGTALQIILNKEHSSDINEGLKAIIHAVTPSLDPVSAEITAFILRGDFIDMLKKNPEFYQNYFLTSSPQKLNEYCKDFILDRGQIGEFELMVLSEIFERPIHIYGGKDVVQFGACWKKNEPIKLRFDAESKLYVAK